MTFDTEPFTHSYRPGSVHFGRKSVGNIGDVIEDHGYQNALVVTGHNVGANTDVMDPITKNLGDRLAGVFAGTTPEKKLETVFAGIERVDATDADILIGVGSGSSVDVRRGI